MFGNISDFCKHSWLVSIENPANIKSHQDGEAPYCPPHIRFRESRADRRQSAAGDLRGLRQHPPNPQEL